MKMIAALLPALSIAAAQAAGTLESLKVTVDSPQIAPVFRFQQRIPKRSPDAGPVLQDPKLDPMQPAEAPRVRVADMDLVVQLDRHRDLLKKQLGPSNWDIGVAGDPGFKSYFLTFRQGQRLVIAPLGDDLNRLRGDGINATVEPGVVYNFKVSINIFNPVRGSTLNISPVNGTRGPKHSLKTGELLDSVKAHSTVFSSDGIEYWGLHGTDVDPATNTLAKTRSFLFIHMDGMNSKAWPLAQDSLPLDTPAGVDFGGNKFSLTRTVSALLIRKSR